MTDKPEYEIAADKFAALVASLGLAVTAEFVPFSKSRNASEPNPSLNWRCTVTRANKPVTGLESVDYIQGIGHAPSHKHPPKLASGALDKWAQSACAKVEAETGTAARISTVMGGMAAPNRLRPIPAPTANDVLQSLCSDSDVLNYATYEDWAGCFGYDPDSRKGEAIYRACLAHALALRAAIGDSPLSELCQLAGEC